MSIAQYGAARKVKLFSPYFTTGMYVSKLTLKCRPITNRVKHESKESRNSKLCAMEQADDGSPNRPDQRQ